MLSFAPTYSLLFLAGVSAAQHVSHLDTTLDCTPSDPQAPFIVTPNCTDPGFIPTIDSDEDLTSPVPHRRVSGHFNGTKLTFNFYLPPKDLWQGRFFQLAYPLHNSTATADTIEFGIDSGAYTVQVDGTSGFRAEAAAAKLSRIVAAEYYGWGKGQIYGYIWGGSGGSLQTVGAMELSHGVWQGAVPFVQAIPISYMNNPTYKNFAGLVLRNQSKAIIDAVSQQGHGEPYPRLNDAQSSILKNVTAFGVPPSTWEAFDEVADIKLVETFVSSISELDPTYAADFWSLPGYLGTEHSSLGELFRNLLVEYTTNITALGPGNGSVMLGSPLPNSHAVGLQYNLLSGNGTIAGLLKGQSNADGIFAFAEDMGKDVLAAVQVGSKVRVDNRWVLAALSHARHQVPSQARGFYGFDHLRHGNGDPIYPQRSVDISQSIAKAVSGGSTHSGAIRCKAISVFNMEDYNAFPWHGDWYQSQVRKALGKDFEDNFRLWFNERAAHEPYAPEQDEFRTVSFRGILEQALRDLSKWVENDTAPRPSTNYTVSTTSQVVLADRADTRHGIQPLVTMTANGAAHLELATGTEVELKAHLEVPLDAGAIVKIEWDVLGTGDFKAVNFGAPTEAKTVSTKFTYSQPGNFTPSVRVTAQREGNMATRWALVQNLGRVSIDVLR